MARASKSTPRKPSEVSGNGGAVAGGATCPGRGEAWVVAAVGFNGEVMKRTPSVLPPTGQSTRRLRAHVDLLGRLLGEVLATEGGQELFALEESVRRQTQALRQRHEDGARVALD